MATEWVELEDIPVQSEHEVNGLMSGELFWRNHQLWLQECGLDPVLVNGSETFLCEDAIPLFATQLVDAIRVEDGAFVVLKLISKSVHPEEAEIFEYFSTPELVIRGFSACSPLLNALSPPDDEDKLIFVMKLMRKYDSPRFNTFGEVVKFFRQMFEGMQFMHHHRVAHRDGNSNNIMMDGKHLFPPASTLNISAMNGVPRKGCSSSERPNTITGPSDLLNIILLTSAYPVSSGQEKTLEHTQSWPFMGGDRSPREFGVLGKLDPFATDIYYLGNLIRREFLDVSRISALAVAPKLGFEFMRPLVSDMVQSDPAKRPTIDEVVSRFQEIHSRLSWWKLRSRVVKKTEVTA
ncbi:hypothetical protein B0H16DRAFT_1553380 [Mycena metata]|uniref:Protein kinase domain-containing protein n=1 Tax=Mycena metata TaxID=1033252 RepID=A0AAD7ISZ7_9AGAR|nr:hypothetical protein B0H16DRAFT_1553380 [Mycena metata]